MKRQVQSKEIKGWHLEWEGVSYEVVIKSDYCGEWLSYL